MPRFSFFRSRLFYSLLLPVCIIVVLVVLQQFPDVIERFYTYGFYYYWSGLNAKFTGIISWSIGDVLYLLAGLFFLVLLIRYLVYLFRGKHVAWYAGMLRFVRFVLWTYIVFQLSWGLNYHRAGSAYQLSLSPPPFKSEMLMKLADVLRDSINKTAAGFSANDTLIWYEAERLQHAGKEGYDALALQHKFIHSSATNIKWSFFNRLGGFGGFTGYFNPFTGEAQVIRRIPAFNKPYVLCHELAHHQGFASEEEANLIGYLAAVRHPKPAVRYSARHDLYYYTLYQLHALDSVAAKQHVLLSDTLVRMHRRQEVDYHRSQRNVFTGWLNAAYSRFLKFNNQSRGLASYSYVTAWLIAYAEKYGWDKL